MNRLFLQDFPPASVAIYSDGAGPHKAADLLQENLRSGFFPGEILPVDWRAAKPAPGRTRADALPGKRIGLAVIATGAEELFSALRDAERHGAKTIALAGSVLPSSAAAPSKRIRRYCEAKGLLLLGPDFQGIALPRLHLGATLLEQRLQPGRTGLLAQSAAFFHEAAGFFAGQGLGASAFIHTGSGPFAPFIDWMAEDEQTRVIALELSAFSDPRGILSAVRAAARAKTVLVLAPGGSAREAGITASLSGEIPAGAAAKRALERCGAAVFENAGEFLAAIQGLEKTGALGSGRAALIADSAFAATRAAGSALRAGLGLPRPEGRLLSALAEEPGLAQPPSNPFLVSPALGAPGIRALARKILASPEYACVFLCLRPALAAEFSSPGKSPAVIAGKPAFALSWADPERGALALAAAAGLARVRRAKEESALPDAFAPGLPEAVLIALRSELRVLLRAGRFSAEGAKAEQVLRLAGIETGRATATAASISAAVAAAEKIGFPAEAELLAPGAPQRFRGVFPEGETMRGFLAAAEKVLREKWPLAGRRGIAVRSAGAPTGERRLSAVLEETPSGRAIRLSGRPEAAEFIPLTRRAALRLARDAGVGTASRREAFASLLLRLSALFELTPELAGAAIEADAADPGRTLSASLRLSAAESLPDEAFAFPPAPRGARLLPVKNGALSVRTLRPEDAPALQALFSRMAPESVFRRFHSALSVLTDRQAALFASVDPEREIALAAFSEDGLIRAVARARRRGRAADEAEFAIAVDDGFQRRGAASGLLRLLEADLPSIGCRALRGEILAGNAPMISLAEKLGFKLVARDSVSGILAYQKDTEEHLS